MDIYLDPEANKAFREGEEQGVTLTTKLNSVTYEKGVGIHLNFEGAEFPQKGMRPEDSQDIIRAINIMKAVFIEAFKLRPTVLSLIKAFNRVAGRVMKQYILKPDYMSRDTLEIKSIVYRFLKYITSDHDASDSFATYFAHILQYDNAYRLRFIDMFSEANKDMLVQHPRLEMSRLMHLFQSREDFHNDVARKFGYVHKLLITLLFFPKYKRAFKAAFTGVNWDVLQYDDMDAYWACLRTDYKFMGMTNESRMEYA
jgi:hypothetical protein